MTDNVTRLPEPPHRCEFPHCHDSSEGMAKKFNKRFCGFHRKQMLLYVSYLAQLEDESKKKQAENGLIERLQHLSAKSEAVFLVDRETMNEIKGMLTDQAAVIASWKDSKKDG